MATATLRIQHITISGLDANLEDLESYIKQLTTKGAKASYNLHRKGWTTKMEHITITGEIPLITEAHTNITNYIKGM